jgi:hypothetical protein
MSDSVSCEKCGKEGRRRRFYPCPENWWWIEVKVDGITMMGHACSVECKDALWQEGPGKRWTSEEIEKTLAEEPEWPKQYGRPVPACSMCGRPTWDGGHALNERECSEPNGEICQLHTKLNAARAEVDMLRGVGCNEGGDGPCGVCIKCVVRGKLSLEDEAILRWMNAEFRPSPNHKILADHTMRERCRALIDRLLKQSVRAQADEEEMKAEYDFSNAERGRFYRKSHVMRSPEETIQDLKAALKEATQPRNQEIWDKLDQIAKTLVSTAQEIGDRPIIMWLGALVESDAEKYEEKYGQRTKGHAKAADFIMKLLKFPTDELDQVESALYVEPEGSLKTQASRTYKDWAARIAQRLSDAELNKLTGLLDNDADDDFYHSLNEINATRNPQEYAEVVSAKTQVAEANNSNPEEK